MILVQKVVGRTGGGLQLVRALAQRLHLRGQGFVGGGGALRTADGIEFAGQFGGEVQRTGNQPGPGVTVFVAAAAYEMVGGARGRTQLVGLAAEPPQRAAQTLVTADDFDFAIGHPAGGDGVPGGRRMSGIEHGWPFLVRGVCTPVGRSFCPQSAAKLCE